MIEAFHFAGTVLPDGERRTVFVADGQVRASARASTLVASDVWLVPGLVDAHCHVGLGPHGGIHHHDEQAAQAVADRDAGALTLRDCGVPVDTRWMDEREDLPQIIRHGRHIARPKRHTRDIGIEVNPDELVAAVEHEVSRGDGWVKLVGDWIDREAGDITPLWPLDELTAAIERAHELGARVTAHAFGEDVLPDLVRANIDCIEHGTGMSPDVIDAMAAKKIALVPTLINIARFPEIAEYGHRFPRYADHMRSLHRTVHERIHMAYEAGVPIYSGTDAGSEVVHGRIADEILALRGAGLSAADAVGAASWRARDWLGVPDGLAEGSPANFVVYPADPLLNLTVLRHPAHIVLNGHLFTP